MAKINVEKKRIYETYVTLDTAVAKEAQDSLFAKVRRAVEDAGGKWLQEASRGKKKLGFPVKKRTEAMHWVLYSEGSGKVPGEIAQVLRFDTTVLRSQTVVVEKVPESQAEPEIALVIPADAAEDAEGEDKGGEL